MLSISVALDVVTLVGLLIKGIAPFSKMLNMHVDKKNLILKIKKNHKAQNQFAQTRVHDELRQ